jgi:hypothetical protein
MPSYLAIQVLPVHHCSWHKECKLGFGYHYSNLSDLEMIRIAVWDMNRMVTAVAIALNLTNMGFFLYGE